MGTLVYAGAYSSGALFGWIASFWVADSTASYIGLGAGFPMFLLGSLLWSMYD